MVGWPGSRQNSLFTITADTHEVRHNPEYYVMRHFSKYVRPGAKVLGTTSHFNSMAIAFRNPDGTIVVVTQNALEDERPFEFADPADAPVASRPRSPRAPSTPSSSSDRTEPRKANTTMTATTPETTVETLPYKNPDLPASERIADLLSRMTLEEKVGQMMQLDARGGDLDELIVNKHVGSILHTSPEDLPRAVETVNTKTRLGIPLVIGDDCIHGYSFWPGARSSPPSSAWR